MNDREALTVIFAQKVGRNDREWTSYSFVIHTKEKVINRISSFALHAIN